MVGQFEEVGLDRAVAEPILVQADAGIARHLESLPDYRTGREDSDPKRLDHSYCWAEVAISRKKIGDIVGLFKGHLYHVASERHINTLLLVNLDLGVRSTATWWLLLNVARQPDSKTSEVRQQFIGAFVSDIHSLDISCGNMNPRPGTKTCEQFSIRLIGSSCSSVNLRDVVSDLKDLSPKGQLGGDFIYVDQGWANPYVLQAVI